MAHNNDFFSKYVLSQYEKDILSIITGDSPMPYSAHEMVLFASGVKDLLGLILSRLSPKSEVRKCWWFNGEADSIYPDVMSDDQWEYAVFAGVSQRYYEEVFVGDVVAIGPVKEEIQLTKSLNKLKDELYGQLNDMRSELNLLIASFLSAFAQYEEIKTTFEKALGQILTDIFSEGFHDLMISIGHTPYRHSLFVDDNVFPDGVRDIAFVEKTPAFVRVRMDGRVKYDGMSNSFQAFVKFDIDNMDIRNPQLESMSIGN